MDKLNSASRRILAAAIVSVTAMAAAHAAVNEDVVSQMDPGMMAALERDLGITPAQYARYLEVERLAPETVATAEAQFDADFAGAWLTHDESGDTRLVVGTTDSHGLRQLGEAEVRQVDFNLAQLESAVDDLNAIASSQVLRQTTGIQSWGIDLPTNRVVVTISPDAKDDLIRFIARSGIDADTLQFEVSEETPSTLINIIGGLQYNGCSIGFSVTQGATKGFVTAGHCGNVGNAVRINNVTVGSFQRSDFPGADAAWATVRQSDTLTNFVWQYSGNSGYAVTGSQEAVIGAQVCRSGFRTGWQCGTITRNNVTVNYGEGAVTGLRESNACAGQGDSGGSWVASANQAQGVTSGGALGNDGTNCGIAQNQRRTWFQRLTPMLNSYGLNLVTN